MNNPELPQDKSKFKVYAGLVLLVFGAVLLLQQLNLFFFPYWLISWPMGMIVLGIFIGAKRNFQNPFWFILIIIGLVNLLDDAIPGFSASQVVWPILIIAIGVWIILKRNHNWDAKHWNKDWRSKYERRRYNYPNQGDPIVDYTTSAGEPNIPPSAGSYSPTGDEHLDTVSVFGGVDRTILAKNFQGGEIVNVFGGTELDFTKADINGRIVIDITQIFGSTKIIVPSNWHVVTDLSSIFAGVDDKRIKNTAVVNTDKILMLKGVSIFGGIDLRSY